MALTRIEPVPARVHWDQQGQQPRSVEWGRDRLEVLGLEAVRDERHAYQTAQGPRLTLVVATSRGHAMLTWHARGRRWYLEALEATSLAA